MKRLYVIFFLVIFALTIYGSGISDSSEFTTKISPRLKRTDNPSLWSVNLTTPKIEILNFGETGVSGPVKDGTRKKLVLPKGYAVKKRKALMKKVKGLSQKLPFKKKSALEEKLEIHPLGATGITNDRIGEIAYSRPIMSRIRKIGSRLAIRRRTDEKAERREQAFSSEDVPVTDLPDSKEAIFVEESTETTTELPISSINETGAETLIKEVESILKPPALPPVEWNGTVGDLDPISVPLKTEVIKKEEDILKPPSLPPAEWNPTTPIADSTSNSTLSAETKRPLLSRVKSLGKKIPLRRKGQAQSKLEAIEVDAEGKGVEENRIARLNVWWVRNFVVTEDSKPTAYFDEETIAVIGFDRTINSSACRLLEPILKEEKEKALQELSTAGVELKPVDLDTMLDLIAGCKTEGVADDKWNAWTLLNGIAPGTKWCGRGDIAKSYEELGPEADIDRCCRAHDHCPIKIKPFKRKYGLTNLSLYTKSHCDCDDEFEMCLRATKNALAEVLGNLYFNVLKIQCVEESKSPSENCLSRNDCGSPKSAKMYFRDSRKFVRKPTI